MVSITNGLIYLQIIHRIPIAAIVAGSVGGLAVVIAAIVLVLYFRRQPSIHKYAPTFVVDSPDPFVLPAATFLPLSTKVPLRQNGPPVIPTAFGQGPWSSSSSSNAMDLGVSKTSPFGQGTVGTPVGNAIVSTAQAGETEHQTQDATSAQQGRFTGEQISSMTQRLLRQNLPAPIVATVVESMINANTEPSASASQVDVAQAEGLGARSVHNQEADAPPPSYDYKTRSPHS
jgi:hypothetical protein